MANVRTIQGRATQIARRLAREYPEARCALNFDSPYQLLVATILSAQCTDERVNLVTPELFEKYPTSHDLAMANPDELEELIRPTGFFRNKARSLIGMASAVVERYGGEIPKQMEDLVTLPGVGRKTANVLQGVAFSELQPEGIAVDTHVKRLSIRLGLTKSENPDIIERDLMSLLPRSQWGVISLRMIMHGRAVCAARRPKCRECCLVDLCPSAEFT